MSEGGSEGWMWAELTQRDAAVAEPSTIDMHRVGTIANILRYAIAAALDREQGTPSSGGPAE